MTDLSEPSDERYLDDLFEAFTEARSTGSWLDWRAHALERPHLEEQIEELWTLASRMTEARVRLTRIGDYELVRELGRGSMGQVHLAEQLSLGRRPVALKVLPAALTIGLDDRRRFLAEARSLARVRHPNIVEIYEVIEEPERVAFAMEWIEGGTLAELIERRAGSKAAWSTEPGHPDSMKRAEFVLYLCRLGVQLARALHEMHASELVHRDVKPSNILVRPDGSPVLSDFGLVRDQNATRQTRSGIFLGTLAFAPPEQLRGEELDARADTYSLACTLYYALTGELPHGGTSELVVLQSIQEGRALPLRRHAPDLPRELEIVLSVAMSPDSKERYASALEFAEDLERLLSLQPIHARPPNILDRSWKWLRRHRVGLLAASVGAVLSAALALAWMAESAAHERRLERAAEAWHRGRLLLLDTELARRTALSLEYGAPAGLDRLAERAEEALLSYDEAAALDPSSIELMEERAALRTGLEMLARREPLPELAEDAAPAVLRSHGLRAYVSGDVRRAVDAWSRLELQGEPDPFVCALLGQAQLVLDRPALAYPRLMRAARNFPSAGFLQVSAARAALACGDSGVAQRLARAAEEAQIPSAESERVALETDLVWAAGGAEEAAATYDEMLLPESYHRYAQHAVEQGLFERAVFAYGTLVSNDPSSVELRREFLRQVRRMWVAMDAETQRERLLAGLRGEREELGYLFGVLAQVRTSIEWFDRRSTDARSTAPFTLRWGDELFERDLRARRWSDDSIEALTLRIAVDRIDLQRLTELEDMHEELVDHWLAGGGSDEFQGRLAAQGAWLPEGRTPFGPPYVEPDPCFRVIASNTELGVSFAAMWNEFHSAADDIDGDGVPDFLLCCIEAEGQPPRAGRLCAISGADATLLWERVGEAYADIGANVSLVGDADGDGVLDAIVTRGSLRRTGRQELMIVSGVDGSILNRFSEGEIQLGVSGQVVGLGVPPGVPPRFAVGAPRGFRNEFWAGRLRLHTLSGESLWECVGELERLGLGASLANVGDMDGDGYDDLFVGSQQNREAGGMRIVSGASGELLSFVEARGVPNAHAFALAGDRQGPDGPIMPFSVASDEGGARLALFDLQSDSVRFGGGVDARNIGFGLFTESLGDLDGDGRSEYSVSSLSGRSPFRPSVRVYRADGSLMAKLDGFIWLRRIGYDPLLPAPRECRLVAIGFDAWSRYCDRPVGGPTRVSLLEFVP